MNRIQQEPPQLASPEVDDDAVIGRAMRSSLVAVGALLLLAGGVAALFLRPEKPAKVKKTELAPVEKREVPTLEPPRLPFSEITEEAGIDFVHENGAAGDKLLPETMGPGCAFLDYDSDGDQDLLMVNSNRWPWDTAGNQTGSTMALYQNDGTGAFKNVTAGSGLDISFYGQGVAVGDYDNDGRVDLFLTAVGKNRLFHNEGAGKFIEVTDPTGLGGDENAYSSSAGWFDFDRDGDLDLFVCNYVQWSREYDVAQNFQLTGGGRAYGRPQNFEGTFPDFYRNDGDGKFTEISEQAGLRIRTPTTGDPMAKSLGVTFADFDRDGWLDILVANDTVQNFLFRNQQDGTFTEMGALVGVAFDMNGMARGAMGIDVASFRNDDSLGIAIGNFANEMTALYVTRGEQMNFVDEAISSGLGPSTRLRLTFGVLFSDIDLDGRLDLFATNGHLEDEINRVQPSQHYEQPPQLFWNCGPTQATEFLPLGEEVVGTDFVQPVVGRGASYADIDGDGDLDLLLACCGSSARLFRNDQQTGNHWLRVKLIGSRSNRDAIGAEVHLSGPDLHLRQVVMPTRSYLSQVESTLTFGLGETSHVSSLTIHWPDGSEQTISETPVDQIITVIQE